MPHQTAEFLSLYVLFNVQRFLVGGTISIVYNLISITNEHHIQYNKRYKKLSYLSSLIVHFSEHGTISEDVPVRLTFEALAH